MAEMQVFTFAKVSDEGDRKVVYDEIGRGRSRFGMWDQQISLRDEYYGKNRLLLEIRPGDWIVHINMPEYGKCVAVQAAGEYQFDVGLTCPDGRTDFNNVIPNRPETIVEFDRRDPNVVPSINLGPMKRIQRVYQVGDFLFSLENLRQNKYGGVALADRASVHLQDRVKGMLSEITKAIHEMNKSKEFERFLQKVFSSVPGAKATPNGFGWRSDHGADLLVEFASPVFGIGLTSSLAVQAKSYEGDHFDLKGVDQIVEGVRKYGADAGLLITTANRTQRLEDYIQTKSEELDIYLIAGPEVAEFVLRHAPAALFGTSPTDRSPARPRR